MNQCDYRVIGKNKKGNEKVWLSLYLGTRTRLLFNVSKENLHQKTRGKKDRETKKKQHEQVDHDDAREITAV